MYGTKCETWSLTIRKEHELGIDVFMNKVLWKATETEKQAKDLESGYYIMRNGTATSEVLITVLLKVQVF